MNNRIEPYATHGLGDDFTESDPGYFHALAETRIWNAIAALREAHPCREVSLAITNAQQAIHWIEKAPRSELG